MLFIHLIFKSASLTEKLVILKYKELLSPAWFDRTDVNHLAYSSHPLPILLSFVVLLSQEYSLNGRLREVQAFLHRVTQLKSRQNLPFL